MARRMVGSVAAAVACCALSCGGSQVDAPVAQVDQMPVRGYVVFDPGPDDGGRDTYTILRTTIAQCGDEWLGDDAVVTLEQWASPNEIAFRLPDGTTGNVAYCVISQGCGRTPAERGPACGGGVDCVSAQPSQFVVVDETARPGYRLVRWSLPGSAGEGSALVRDCSDPSTGMAPVQ
jgi:hypothetical protein